MHEELENFERNHVWELVDPPLRCKPTGTKWVWKNKDGEKGEVVRNKSRLVAQGCGTKWVWEEQRGDRLRGDLCSRSSFGGDQNPSSFFCG
jgi:hypothetical protein